MTVEDDGEKVRSTAAWWVWPGRTSEKAELFGEALSSKESAGPASVSLQAHRLRMLQVELDALLFDEEAPGTDSPFRYVEAPEPRLTVAPGASIIVDAESGYFIFQESAGDNRAAIVSASEARVLDQVVCYLVDGRKAGASATANRAVKMLVGSSLN